VQNISEDTVTVAVAVIPNVYLLPAETQVRLVQVPCCGAGDARQNLNEFGMSYSGTYASECASACDCQCRTDQ
jgi:hypothetical protein